LEALGDIVEALGDVVEALGDVVERGSWRVRVEAQNLIF
jgi:hypothetical protein